MQLHILTVTILASILTSPAQTSEKGNVLAKYKEDQTGIVSQQGSLAIVYQPPPEGTHVILANEFHPSRPIYYNYFAVSNKPSLLYILKPEYEFRFSAVAEDGKDVEPTSLGTKFGRHFDALKTFDPEAIAINDRGTPVRGIAALPDLPPGYGPSIPAPDKLFTFEKPGKYTMTIESACFASKEYPPSGGLLESNYYLVKFPPTKLTVVVKAKE